MGKAPVTASDLFGNGMRVGCQFGRQEGAGWLLAHERSWL